LRDAALATIALPTPFVRGARAAAVVQMGICRMAENHTRPRSSLWARCRLVLRALEDASRNYAVSLY